MSRRAASPANSDYGFDIAGALVGDPDDDDRIPERPVKRRKFEAEEPQIKEFDDGSDEEEIAVLQQNANRQSSKTKGSGSKQAGSFKSMGLDPKLLKDIERQGYRNPTPIQRKCIPAILLSKDVVGMARTGSGKTAAFVIPMINRLKVHSSKVGSRAVILSPTKELAAQTSGVVRQFSKSTNLRSALLVGEESLEQQFEEIAANPDIVIATPGRLQHLQVEMRWDLSSIEYAVFDEADRLFEMGFGPQIGEILHSLPPTRQTLLFSATMPSALHEFAAAGLQDPIYVRLDSEGKISPDLQSGFFSVKSADKEGALLHILQDVIKIPTGKPEAALKHLEEQSKSSKKKKSDSIDPRETPTQHSTMIFTATKYHVEYITTMLQVAGYEVSYLYGQLDQTARKRQTWDFRSGMTHIMVVTDVAARGIDIPILANVINYDFPPQPRIFVHRVGRTARAGRKGWSYNLIQDVDLPYLVDLQLFLQRPLTVGRDHNKAPDYAKAVVLGSLVKEDVERHTDWVLRVLEGNTDLNAQRTVMMRGEQIFRRNRPSAAKQSVKRSKLIVESNSWIEPHPLFQGSQGSGEVLHEQMMARISKFRPQETVFEIGKRGAQSQIGEVSRKRRERIGAKRKQLEHDQVIPDAKEDIGGLSEPSKTVIDLEFHSGDEVEVVDYDEPDSGSLGGLEVTVMNDTEPPKTGRKATVQDSEHFMPYTPAGTNVHEERGYGVHSGSSDVRNATMDLTNDEVSKSFARPGGPQKYWDKRHKKYVSRGNDEDGSRGAKMVVGESGNKIPASLRSGRFEAWKKHNRIERLPRVGESESKGTVRGRTGERKFKHSLQKTPKTPDKYRDDYYKKKKQFDAAKERITESTGDGRKARGEMRSVDDAKKARLAKQQRREKTARPSKKLRK